MKDNETHSVGTELPGLHHLRCPVCLHAIGCHIPERNRCACSSAMAICTASFPIPPTATDMDSTGAKTTIAEPLKQVTEPETCVTCGHTRACHDAKPNDPLCCPAGMSCWHFGPPPPPVSRTESPASCARCGVGFVSWDAIETDEYEGQLRKVHADCPAGVAKLCLWCSAPFTDGHACQKLAAARERFQEKLAASKEAPLYASLRRVLDLAFAQAASGKGKERHASEGTPFEAQPMVTEGLEVGSNHFAIGQARKKLRESTRLPKDAALREILGAIDYAVGAYLTRERLP